jgi:hypothetical protein
MRCLMCRKTSRTLRFARFRATAFPIFFEAIIPNLFLPNPLGMEKIMHNLSTRFFFPSSITFLNSGRLTRRSVFLKEKSSIHSALEQRVMTYQNSLPACDITSFAFMPCKGKAMTLQFIPLRSMRKYRANRGLTQSDCQTFPAFTSTVCQHASSTYCRASFAEAVHTFTLDITGLKSSFHESVLK